MAVRRSPMAWRMDMSRPSDLVLVKSVVMTVTVSSSSLSEPVIVYDEGLSQPLLP